MVMERLPNPKGDRVKITMSGKFLPYKYYGPAAMCRSMGSRRDKHSARELSGAAICAAVLFA
jgi:hypothetical protein